MHKQELLKIVDNRNFIAGIHNYCDRWCERCAFTCRCELFTMEEKIFPDQESRDINNKKFWEALQVSFSLTMELLMDAAKGRGIDQYAVDDGKKKLEAKARRTRAEEYPAVKAAKWYSGMVSEWFDRHEHLFKGKQEELEIESLEGAGANIIDAVEVIRWYQDQIMVKLMRAFEGEELEKEFENDNEMQEFPRDSDGSAKVALVGLDRSLGAWGELWKHVPDEAGTIMNILIHLDRLRTNVERHFPRARTFVRPGFDQEL